MSFWDGFDMLWYKFKAFFPGMPNSTFIEGGQRGSKWAFLSFLGHFDRPKKSWREKRWTESFEFVSRHDRDIPETHSEKEIQLNLSPNVRFSNFSKFPIHFYRISIVKFERAVGGSNDLQSSPNFFWQLLITFVHRIKKANQKLKKCWNLKHPSVHAW